MQLGKTVRVLCDAGVEFVIVGGVAAALHGSAIVTIDLDVCYSRSSLNLRRLAAALEPFRPRPRDFPGDLPFVLDESALRNGMNFTLRTGLGDLDLLGEVSGIGGYDEAVARSIAVEAFGRRVLALDLRSLIESKRAAGREKDLATLPALEGLLEAEEE